VTSERGAGTKNHPDFYSYWAVPRTTSSSSSQNPSAAPSSSHPYPQIPATLNPKPSTNIITTYPFIQKSTTTTTHLFSNNNQIKSLSYFHHTIKQQHTKTHSSSSIKPPRPTLHHQHTKTQLSNNPLLQKKKTKNFILFSPKTLHTKFSPFLPITI
jgi:hypothetical protein